MQFVTWQPDTIQVLAPRKGGACSGKMSGPLKGLNPAYNPNRHNLQVLVPDTPAMLCI